MVVGLAVPVVGVVVPVDGVVVWVVLLIAVVLVVCCVVVVVVVVEVVGINLANPLSLFTHPFATHALKTNPLGADCL